MISAYVGFGLVAAASADYNVRLVVGRAPFGTRNHDLAIALGALVSIASVALVGEPLWPAVASGVAGAAWFAVTKTQLRLPSKPMRVAPGQRLPAFEVARTDGARFASADLAAAAPALLVVYRGKW